MPGACLSVVMPCYNEVDTVRDVAKAVLDSPYTAELLIVDDGSDDGTRDVLAEFADPRLRVLLQPVNQGKGAALRRGFAEAKGPFVIVQDADLEYDPGEFGELLAPLIDGRADVVYGSRFVSQRPHRVLYYWHSVGNRVLTTASNVFTNLNLSDMETCYKAFRKEVLDSFVIEEDRFGVEPEITAKVARGGWRVYEVGISYSGRTYAEGKKIGWRDGMRALYCIARYSSVGEHVVRRRSRAREQPASVPVTASAPDPVSEPATVAFDVAGVPLQMLTAEGTDQVATAVTQHDWKGFEPPMPEVLAELVAAFGDDGVVVDVGANTGFYSLVAAAANPTTRVLAFEPYPPVRILLDTNLALNATVAARVEVLGLAVSSACGRATLYLPDADHGLVETSASLSATFKETHSGTVEVDVTTLDAFDAERGELDVRLIKVDVEGMEHEVLAGASRLIERCRPLVFVEVLPVGRLDSLESLRAHHAFVDVRLRPRQAFVGGAVAFDAEGWNHLWVPEERLHATLPVLERSGLSVDTLESR